MPNSTKLIRVIVKPNSKKGPLVDDTENGLVVYVKEPAIDGKANAAVVALLAKHFGVPKTHICLKSGQTSRNKVFTIHS